MTINKGIGSYQDVRDALDKALEEETAVWKVETEGYNQAVRLAMRFNMFRKLDREASKKIFPITDPRYNVSVYDVLQFQRCEDGVIIRRPPPLVLRRVEKEEETS